MTAASLNFLGKILCCPPIVYSPKGRPQATRTVIIAITPNNTAPNIENINQLTLYKTHSRYAFEIIKYILQINSKICDDNGAFVGLKMEFCQYLFFFGFGAGNSSYIELNIPFV